MKRSFFLTRLFQCRAYWLVPGALLLLLGTLIGDAQARPEAQEVFPTIAVDTTAETVEGYDWPLGTTVQISIDDPGTSENPDFQASAIVGEDPTRPDAFALYFSGQYDLKPGDVVTVSDGVTTKVHTATSLRILGASYEDDIMWGTGGDPGIWIHVNIADSISLDEVQADQDGNWIVDFTGIYDVQFDDILSAWQTVDDDGDRTRSLWTFPIIRANWYLDQLSGDHTWLPGSTIQVSIYSAPSDQTPVYTISLPAGDGSCLGCFSLDLHDQFDLQPGQWIVVTDGYTSRDLKITRLHTTTVDYTLDTVSGIADPDLTVYITVCPDMSDDCFNRQVDPAADGSWIADFANPTPEYNWTLDIERWATFHTSQQEGDYDTTWDNMTNPEFWVFLQGQNITGFWMPYQRITVTIDDPDNGAGIDFTNTIFSENPEQDFSFGLYVEGYIIQPGDVVTLTDGYTTKQTVVTELVATGADILNDRVFGTAAPGSIVDAYINWARFNIQVITGADGIWVADFNSTYDIVDDTFGSAIQNDVDYDGTADGWKVGEGSCLPGDSVSGHVWLEDGVTPAPGATVTIEAFDQPYVTPYSFPTQIDGSYACDLPDGTYRLYASADAYSREYYAETIFENATPVQVVTGSPLPGIDFTLDTPSYAFDHMTFNFNEPIIAQLPVRQAIFFGTDRQRILDATYPASPTQDSVIITPHWVHTSAALLQYNYDPEMARRVLEQAGWVDSDGDGVREKDGVRLHLKYATTDLAMRQVIADIFMENMLAVGIEIEVMILPPPIGEWLNTYPDISIAQFAYLWIDVNNDDPIGMMWYLIGENFNFGSYSNPTADQLLHLASLFGTRAEMLPYLEHYQRVVMADPPMMLLLLRIEISDQDGDGVADEDDLCPDVSSQGYDADLDGCLDTTQGLTDLVNQLYSDGEISNRSTRNTLLNQVSKIENLLADGNYARAVSELDKFITLVNNGLASNTLTQSAADQLVAYAESLQLWISESYLTGQSALAETGWVPGFYR